MAQPPNVFAPGAWLRDDVDTDFGHDIDYIAAVTGGPTALGFDRFFGIAGSLDMPPYAFIDQDRTVGIPDREKAEYLTEQRHGLQVPGFREDEVDVRFVDEAVWWLRSVPADRPFLCYPGPVRAAPTGRAAGRGAGQVRAGRPRGRSVPRRLDGGRLVAAIDERGQRDNTLVIVTSDNGAPMIFTDDGDVTRV